MKPRHPQAPAGSTADEQALNVFRSLAVTAAVVLPGFGIVRRIIDPDTADPLWERIAIALFLLACAGLTVVNGWVRRHPHLAIALSLYAVSAGIIHMAYVNGMTVNTSYGLLIMVFACSLALRSRWVLGGYLAAASAGIGVTVMLAHVVEIDPLFYLSAVVAMCMLTYAAQVNRITAEVEMRSARDLAEAAVEARGRFLANISHEIRTPMNGIIGMASLLEDTELTANQRDYLQTIRTSGDALLTLINDVLDFSKIESGRVTLERTSFDPLGCLEEAADLVVQSAREKGVELVCEGAPELPGEVIGDSLRLRQVLVNLLSNAVKFTFHGEVHAALDGQREGARGYRLHGQVRDTGIGIGEHDIDGLFQAFAQADSSTTRRFGGTGLGLSICRELVEHMQGSIRVVSEERRGATFEFDVLLECAAEDGARPQPAPQGAEATLGRVLVFEPQATVRAAVCRQLAGWGFDYDAVAERATALAQLGAGTHSVVLAGCTGPHAAALETAAASADVRVIRLAPMTESPVSADPAEPRQVLYRPLRRAQLRQALWRPWSSAPQDRPLPTQEPAAHAPGDPPPSWDALRILIAEDNPVNQRVTLKMLQRLGYRADVAADGALALAAVAQNRYDLVLMDLQMPVMDGLEATRRIRDLASNHPVCIVAMTANALPGDRDACLEAGMDEFLCKPVKLDALQVLLVRLRDQLEAAKNTSSVMSSSISKNEWASVART